MKHTINDPNTQGKISESDKEAIKNKLNETESWLSSNHHADTADIEAKQK